MADIIQIRRDTAANWSSANPTLANGEQGYETDTGKMKIGNGSTAWTSLAYFAGGGGGGGDMLKSTYDPNDDGVIAVAQLDTNVFLTDGSRAMSGRLDMSNNVIEDITRVVIHADADGLEIRDASDTTTTVVLGSSTYGIVVNYKPVHMGGQKIVSLADPTNSQDAATKAWCEANFGSGGVTDHGNLTGLSDDDHTQYLLANGTRSLSGNWYPDGNGTRKIGDSTHKLAEIWAVDGIFGDLVFEEKTCYICGETFNTNDVLSLIVIKTSSEGTHTVPVHSGCTGRGD